MHNDVNASDSDTATDSTRCSVQSRDGLDRTETVSAADGREDTDVPLVGH